MYTVSKHCNSHKKVHYINGANDTSETEPIPTVYPRTVSKLLSFASCAETKTFEKKLTTENVTVLAQS